MSIDALHTLTIIETMENFLERNRPPEDIRPELDIGYRIEEQSIFIFEIRPKWLKPEEIMECMVAKTTYVNTKKLWKVFWMRSDLKWHSYLPTPTVKTIQAFVKLVEADDHHCFWG
ncbi:DUF3024 domain-containing protein [Hydrotalea sp.]|uniref:DUF3024 domain-containing protein n=1 Tax=Hydrotalea sp. TaxID=2881279 RepID=UPI002638E682|nr:DUF3024 domain-containing protein [Hydrotalea sp.]